MRPTGSAVADPKLKEDIMMRSFRTLATAGALVAALSPAAHALDLFTAGSQARDGNAIRCLLTNVGTKPVFVTTTLTDQDGKDITSFNTCFGAAQALAPGKACAVDSTTPGWKTGSCRFTVSSSKVRGALLVLDSMGNVTSALPATK
jgi:hypothetical protein